MIYLLYFLQNSNHLPFINHNLLVICLFVLPTVCNSQKKSTMHKHSKHIYLGLASSRVISTRCGPIGNVHSFELSRQCKMEPTYTSLYFLPRLSIENGYKQPPLFNGRILLLAIFDY